MGAVLGTIIGLVISSLVAGIMIWIVSALKLGITVKNFWWAMLVGIVIAVLSVVLAKIVDPLMTTEFTGVWKAVMDALATATIIYSAGYWFKDNLNVRGFGGALLAALSIAGIGYLVGLILN